MNRHVITLACGLLSIGLAQMSAAADNRAGTPSSPPCTAAEQNARTQPPKGTGVYLAQIQPPPCGNCTMPSGQRGNFVQGQCRVCENR